MRLFWLFNVKRKKHNIGDVAISLGIRKWLNHFVGAEIKEYSLLEMVDYPSHQNPQIDKIVNSLEKRDIILMHESCLGLIYLSRYIEAIIRTYTKLKELGNRVIQLPSTMWYNTEGSSLTKVFLETKNRAHASSSKFWRNALKVDAQLFNNPNLHLLIRDSISFKIAKKHFETCKISLVPDFAYYLASEVPKSTGKRRGACLVLRRFDSQRTLNTNQTLEIQKLVKSVLSAEINDLNANYSRPDLKGLIEVWRKYQSYELIVTDRLHGVIFSALTKTPCVTVNQGCIIPHKLWQQNFFPSLKYVTKNSQIVNAVEAALSEPVETKDLEPNFSYTRILL